MGKIKDMIVDKTFGKFIIVGVINTIVGTSVMFIVYNVLQMNYWISSASNYLVGSIVSYFLNKYYTFQDRKKSYKQVILFIINITICYCVSYGLARHFVRWVMQGFDKYWYENIAMIVGMGMFIILNYFGQHILVFNK